jgi:phosphoglycolate phosphatase-like HAD superfamily hydrolase
VSSIVFDLDGTLLDSRKRHEIVLVDVIKMIYGERFRIDIRDYMSYKTNGYSTEQYLILRHGLDVMESKKISGLWKELIETAPYLTLDVLYPDAQPLLARLVEKYTLLLLTARKNKPLLIRQLKDLHIYKYFNRIKCINPSNATEEKKIFLDDYYDIVLSIGDTEIDYKAALVAKINFYPLNRGFRNSAYWKMLNVRSYGNLSRVFYFLDVSQ